MKNTLRGLKGLIGAVLMILSALNLVMGGINGRLPTQSPYAGSSIGGDVLYLAFYYGGLPAIAGALMYYGRKRP